MPSHGDDHGAPVSVDATSAPLAALRASEPITSLRVVGTRHDFLLPASEVFRIGAGAVDIQLPVLDAERPISFAHAELSRRGVAGTWLQVVDLNSRNGTLFRGARETDFAVSAGQRFSLATTELLVMDAVLARLRRVLESFLSYTDHTRVDDALALLVEHEAILLLAPRGSECGRLARAIHACSRRRDHPFVELAQPARPRAALLPEFQAASRGTVFASLDDAGSCARLAALVGLLFDPVYAVRPIVAARDLARFATALHLDANRFRSLTMSPLRARPGDIPALLDAMLAEMGSPHRISELPPARLRAMSAHDWPGNRAELRETAERLAALLAHGGNRSAAARSIGHDLESFRRALVRVGALAVRRRSVQLS